jgi:hypothetical protein
MMRLTSLLLLAALLTSCRKNDDEWQRQNTPVAEPTSLNDIYQGEPPVKKGCVICPSPINKNVRLENGMLVFENEEHFRLVRNCLTQTREDNVTQYQNLVSQFITEEDIIRQEEKIFEEFESWYPGFVSLRMKWRQQEDAWLAAGMSEEAVPEAPAVLDPAEQTLLNAEGSVKIGQQVFNIFTDGRVVKEGSCRNHAASFNVYGPFGSNRYLLARTSVTAWPWGTTLYVSATGLRQEGTGYKRVRLPMRAGGSGQLSAWGACMPSMPVKIENTAVVNRMHLGRCYSVLGLPLLAGNGSFSAFFGYNQEDLPPLMLMW